MLNLEKLEAQLDKALKNETKESLTNWLLEKRSKSYLAQLGEGTLKAQKPRYNSFRIKSAKVVIENPSTENSSVSAINSLLLMAA